MLESYNRLPEMARRTGYPYYNVSLQILSKYPILEPSGGGGLYALIEVKPGYVVPFFNEHLDYVKWGPRALRRGDSVASVIKSENEVRTSALAKPIQAMNGLLDQGYPVFLTGDLNEPSSLDYTKETVGTRKGIDEPVQWPVSSALLGIGLRDTYRQEHPDPVQDPGITHPGSGERIDYVYSGGGSKTLSSKIVGERGGKDVSIGFTPWTSDHYAVLSSFETTPAAMPTTVAVDGRMRTVGDKIAISYNAPGSDGNSIAIVREGGDPAAPSKRMDAPGAQGRVDLDTSGMRPGGYEAVLLDGGGSEIARVSFWLRDPRAKLRLSTSQRTYQRGEPIRVSWTDGPANRWDWLAVYKAGASDPHTDSYTDWAYTGLPHLRHSAAEHPRFGHFRARHTGRAVAAAARTVRRALPVDGSVQVGGQRAVHRLGGKQPLARPSGEPPRVRRGHGRLDLLDRRAAGGPGGDHGEPRHVADARRLQARGRAAARRRDRASQPPGALAAPRVRDR